MSLSPSKGSHCSHERIFPLDHRSHCTRTIFLRVCFDDSAARETRQYFRSVRSRSRRAPRRSKYRAIVCHRFASAISARRPVSLQLIRLVRSYDSVPLRAHFDGTVRSAAYTTEHTHARSRQSIMRVTSSVCVLPNECVDEVLLPENLVTDFRRFATSLSSIEMKMTPSSRSRFRASLSRGYIIESQSE